MSYFVFYLPEFHRAELVSEQEGLTEKRLSE